jgi:hypothetical protein
MEHRGNSQIKDAEGQTANKRGEEEIINLLHGDKE